MDDTRTSTLSLLALAHAELLPALSFTDLCALLPISHTRNTRRTEVASLLAQLEKEVVVMSRDNWYALSKTPDIPMLKKRLSISQAKLARNRVFFFLMQAIPFLEGAVITGSVSMGSAHEKSDIDIFCIIKKGRIWTARICLLFLAELFGSRREKKHLLDKLCFNCFIAHTAVFPLQNIASAHMLARAIPLFGTTPLEAFFTANAWTELYVSRPPHTPLVRPSRSLRAISLVVAWLLSGSVGNTLERTVARWQIHRLRSKATRGGGNASGLILHEDIVTLYYPDSKNNTVMARYADAIKQIDF
ncbi:MAG: nucleotidyltransferase domain-containing protein [Candidatus Azambacteria bacterium]|nr:nucleotidyltransferase domain-containing protein [Candidatus Azambacteria bacterium]